MMKKIVVIVNHLHPQLFTDNKVKGLSTVIEEKSELSVEGRPIPELYVKGFKAFLGTVIEEKYGVSVEVRPIPELYGTPGHRNDPTSVRVIYPEHYEGPVLNQEEILHHVNQYCERLFGKTSAQQSADVINGAFKMLSLLVETFVGPLRPKKDSASS